MQLFKCTHCGQPIYFENFFCGNCGSSLGFLTDSMQPIAFDPGYLYQYCANYQENTCNWLVAEANTSPFCRACELNRTIPNLGNPEYVARWKKLEIAKHRLVYSLLRMRLPLTGKSVDEQHGLAFDFVADHSDDHAKRILTGYDKGIITINIAEADDIERELARRSLQEVYRTLLGHFRHEIGHYYWERLIAGTERVAGFRELFGDEQRDYEEALKTHYQTGPPPNWSEQYISSYASAHPWEDWAESWAHYMHILDTLETAYAYGLSMEPLISDSLQDSKVDIKTDPYAIHDFETIFGYWLPLTFAMNSLNRSMGLNDVYPFVITRPAKEKMAFIHEVIQAQY